MALRSPLLVLIVSLAGPIACRDGSRPLDSKAIAVVAPSAPLPEFPCVPFERLQTLLPSRIEGAKKTRDEGASGRYGEVSVSEAERVFKGASGEELSIRIVDTSIVADLGLAIRAAAEQARMRPAEDPNRPIENPHAIGFVRFDANQQRAEANLLVADRFIVAVTGRGYEDAAEVRRIAEQIDVDGLALLR